MGTSEWESTSSVAVDLEGNVFITGWTAGALGGPFQGWHDAFLAKYDTLGTLLWTRQWGTTKVDDGSSVTVDATGNVLVSGATTGAMGGANQGGYDAFLSKWDTSGTLLWTEQLGTSADDLSRSVAWGTSGDVFIR